MPNNKAIIFVGAKKENKFWEQYELDKAVTLYNALNNNWWLGTQPEIKVFATDFPYSHDYPEKTELEKEIKADALKGPFDNYVVFISDHAPMIDTLKIKKHTPPPIELDYNSTPFKTDLSGVSVNNNKKTLIVSGLGADIFAFAARNEANSLTIASHWGQILLGDHPNFDKFNIGLVMPNVPPNDWNLAFIQEQSRLSNLQPPLTPQTPVRWP